MNESEAPAPVIFNKPPPEAVRMQEPVRLPLMVRVSEAHLSVVAVPPAAETFVTVVFAVIVTVAPLKIYRLSPVPIVYDPSPVVPLELVVQLAEAEAFPARVAAAEVV
jgi:hypothetical protein